MSVTSVTEKIDHRAAQGRGQASGLLGTKTEPRAQNSPLNLDANPEGLSEPSKVIGSHEVTSQTADMRLARGICFRL